MDMHYRLLGVCALASVALTAQTLSNKSLTGKYFFREVLLATDTSQTLTVAGTVIFDGNGNVTNGSFASRRETFFTAGANGSGGLGNPALLRLSLGQD